MPIKLRFNLKLPMPIVSGIFFLLGVIGQQVALVDQFDLTSEVKQIIMSASSGLFAVAILHASKQAGVVLSNDTQPQIIEEVTGGDIVPTESTLVSPETHTMQDQRRRLSSIDFTVPPPRPDIFSTNLPPLNSSIHPTTPAIQTFPRSQESGPSFSKFSDECYA